MKVNLTIGIIGTRGIPNRYGGFEAFAGEIAPRLAAKGHQVSVYCAHDQEYQERTMRGVNLLFRHNPESRMGTSGQFFYDLACNLHARKQPFDVILHLGYTSDSVWSAFWSRGARHLTNMDGMEWMRAKYPLPVQKFLKKAEGWAASRSDLMIADSMGIKEYLESRYAGPVRFISYGAEIPDSYNDRILAEFQVEPFQYDLVIARMEPENNIEMAIAAKLGENSIIPLLIFSNETKYGSMLKKHYRQEPLIRFQPANYHQETVNSLRHHSRYYIHGHSAGGTNPSLLEAMACECRILAHDNPFNGSVLQHNNAGFYKTARDLTALLQQPWQAEKFRRAIENNLGSIRKNHSWDFITQEYESAFYQVLES